MSRRRGTDVGIAFTGDAKGFKAAAEDAKKATQKLAEDSKKRGGQIDKGFKDNSKSVNELGRALGGAAGQAGGLASQLLGAATPLGLMTAAIAALAMGWKEAEENLKSYSQQVQRLDHGSKAFLPQAWDTVKEQRKIAKGERQLGRRLMVRGVATGDTGMISEGRDIARGAAFDIENLTRHAERSVKLAEDLAGLYRQQMEAQLEGIALSTKWADMDFRRAEALRIMRDDEEDINDRMQARQTYLTLTNQLTEERVNHTAQVRDIEQAINNLTSDTVEDVKRVADLEGNIANYKRQQEQDIRTVNRFSRQLLNIVEKQRIEEELINDALRERNEMMTRAGSSMRARGTTPNITTNRGEELRGMTEGYIEEFRKTMEMQELAVYHLEGAFYNMFMNIEQGWSGVGQAFIRSFRAMMAEVAAKAALLMLLRVLFPGSEIGVGATGKLMDMFGSGLFSGGGGGIKMAPLQAPALSIGGELTAKGSDLSIVLGRHNVTMGQTT